MTSDEKINAEQTEVTEISDIEATPEVEVTDNTDWDETAEPATADAETTTKPVAEAKEEIEDGEDLAEEQEPEPAEIDATLETVIEAVLFASDEPISPKRLVDVAEAGSVKDVNQCVKDLNAKYRDGVRSFRIEKISGGYQMMTLSAFNPWITKLIKVRSDNKLTPAGLETLAIVAYKQPIMRADIEAIRGVASGEILRNLMYKGMVKIVGRAEVIGRPMLYGTTKKFLDVFGLNTLKDLPKIEELKAPQ
ncbi:MAG: SMC-Scp complex subunit ScpB [Planctomycetota bacterium]|nr:MAG: SMC-Scp complex subunit ScpB [Planctomycetota bacterium]RKY12997.1 MAG: SMC-Scp complex subunit ScpB [Planctomycetota bacterium]